MTISTTAPRVVLNCDGVSKVFPVPIQAYQPTDFLVIHSTAAGVQSVLLLNSDYSLATSGSLNPTAWSMTTLAAAAFPAGDNLQAILNPVEQQQTQYVQGQAFPSLAVQTNFDRLTQMVQRLQDQINRSVRTSDGDINPAMQLPTAIARALTYQAYDVNGNVLCTPALPGTANTPASLGPIIYPRSLAEINAGITPLPQNQVYVWGDLRRYGAVGGLFGAVPAADDSAAFLAACKVGYVLVPADMAFKIVTGVGTAISPLANQVVIQGYGDNSQLYCDTTGTLSATTNYLLYGTGAGCVVRDVFIGNITAPLKWQRRVETTARTTATLLGQQTFTATVAGATTGTLTAAIANGTYSFFFSDGEIRNVTITTGTTANWAGALAANQGPITTATVATIVVGSAANIAIGQQARGYGLGTGAIVTGIAGLFVTLSVPVPAGLATPTVGTYTFFGITFNQAGALLATLVQTNAAGFISPSNNDTEWAALTTLQQNQSWVGPVIYLAGDNCLVQNVKGQNFQVQMTGNNSRALFNRLQGGWNWASIAFLNGQINPVEFSCYAIGNQTDDHAYGGVVAMGYDGVTFIGNMARGVGETSFKIFPWLNIAGNTPGSVGCQRVISLGNNSVAGFQGGIDYNAPFLPTATPGLSQCVSHGDVVSWGPFGGSGYQGSGWSIDVTLEMNAGPAIVAQVDHSRIAVKAMENCYANLNVGVANTCAIIGNNNIADGIQVYNMTTRARTGYSLSMIGSPAQNQSSCLINSDLRDNVTADAVTLQLANCVDVHNVKGNGPLSDVPIGARRQIVVGQAASIPINAGVARSFLVFLGSATVPTFAFPTNLPPGPIELEIVVENGSGGVITPVFAAGYKTAAVTAMPNATMSIWIFFWNGTSLYQKFPQMTTVPL